MSANANVAQFQNAASSKAPAGAKTRTVVLMTKSTKHGGFCVAGVDTKTHEWVRLMTSESEFPGGCGALSEAHLTTEDGSVADVLDVVEFVVSAEVPNLYQVENVEVDFSVPLKKVGTMTFDELLSMFPAASRKKVFYTDADTVDEKYGDKLSYSLILARVENVHVYSYVNSRGNERSKADFTYVSMCGRHSKVDYKGVRMTIPEYDGLDHDLYWKSAYFVLSVGTPFEGRIYKYVAAVYGIEPADQDV